MANEFKIKKGLIVEGASGGTVVNVLGSQGQLLSVTDNLSGSIFAVSDISGVPIFDVNSSGVSYFDGNVGIGTDSPQSKLHLATTGGSTLTIQNTTNSGNAALNFRDEGDNDQFQIYYALGANRSYNLVNGNGLTVYSSQSSSEIARFGNASSGYTDSYFTGDVGIGTTSPDGLLNLGHVASTSSISEDASDYALTFNFTGTTNDYGRHIAIRDNNGDAVASIGGVDLGGAGTTGLYFATGSVSGISEAMRITATGNVGIGTTTVQNKLVVRGSGSGFNSTMQNSTASIISKELTDNAYHSILQLVAVRQSLTTGKDSQGYLGFSTIDDSNNQGQLDAGRIAIVNETGSSRNSATALTFWTNPGGTQTTAAVEKMRINSAGAIKFNNYNSTNNTGTPTYLLGTDASGNIVKTNTVPGSGAGPYLPLSAGSSYPLTGDLYIAKAANQGQLFFGTANANYEIFGGDFWGYMGYNTNGYHRFLIQGAEIMRIHSNSNVGIGTTLPNAKFEVTGNLEDNWAGRFENTNSGGYGILAKIAGTSANERIFEARVGSSTKMIITGEGNVGIGTTSPVDRLTIYDSDDNVGVYFQTATSGTSTGDGFRVGLNNSHAFLWNYENTPLAFATNGSEKATILANGNFGIGTTGPAYKLSVSGGIEAGGLITYSKVAGSLSTTGYAVAGLTAGFNGASAGFEFKCYGSNSKYQRVVYSCHCSGTTWVPGKVIDEGTNDLDVVASANGATITFTFKARSSTQNFSPRIVIQATGHSINSTYA